MSKKIFCFFGENSLTSRDLSPATKADRIENFKEKIMKPPEKSDQKTSQ
jgi:hypothetical protein